MYGAVYFGQVPYAAIWIGTFIVGLVIPTMPEPLATIMGPGSVDGRGYDPMSLSEMGNNDEGVILSQEPLDFD